MLVILKPTATDGDRDGVVRRIADLGLASHVSKSEYRTVVSATGPCGPELKDQLEQLAGVDNVLVISLPYRLASREFHEAATILDIRGVRVGGAHVNVIAGPCAIEDREMLHEVGLTVQRAGATILRGGAFKPRTSPYSFQGKGLEGLKWLREVGDELGMPTITEVMDPRDVDAVAQYADIFQIGARNMQNFNLLLEVGRTDKPVFIKRGPASSITELLMSAEYVLSEGNHRVMICERGIRTFGSDSRYTLDLSAVPLIQERSHLPVFADPSHAAGKRDLVPSLALAAVAAGAAGVIVEVHPRPDRALCDGPQAMLPASFSALMDQIRAIAKVIGRRVWEARPTETVEPYSEPRPSGSGRLE
ncbi:MAG: 3-deoxy-7-phosphoheptulonate synthase [Proteobacteria bacterium]|nr:3-deoxy-7-phosphoheptulonate synthase [Pseudomonadota bacterium]